MIDVFYYYASTLAFVCVISGLLCVYRYYLGNRLTQQANKLKSQMANIKQNFPELAEKRSELVASGIGSLGVDGLMEELGIDPKILNNPLVKGLIDKYAPRLLERLSTKGATDEQNSKPFM